ncbi:unnamed protein product, partial [Rotaria sp. Silwood2]
ESFLIRVFKNQILSLVIDIQTHQGCAYEIEEINKFIYTQIFTMFSVLQYLDFHPSCSAYPRVSFGISPSNVFSSTLLELHIMVHTYADCLYLLDGRFNQLHTFYVTIFDVTVPVLTTINNEVSYSY